MTKRGCHLMMWMCLLAPAAAFGQTPAGEGGPQAALRDIRRGLMFVFDLDGGGIAWSEPSLDITADVIKQLALAATTKR